MFERFIFVSNKFHVFPHFDSTSFSFVHFVFLFSPLPCRIMCHLCVARHTYRNRIHFRYGLCVWHMQTFIWSFLFCVGVCSFYFVFISLRSLDYRLIQTYEILSINGNTTIWLKLKVFLNCTHVFLLFFSLLRIGWYFVFLYFFDRPKICRHTNIYATQAKIVVECHRCENRSTERGMIDLQIELFLAK